MTEMFGVPNFGPKEAAFMRALAVKEGEADTVEIRRLTDLNSQQVAYRYDKLEEYGLVTTGYKESENTPGRPTRYARLTKEGQRVVESGELERVGGKAEPSVAVEELRSEVATLRQKHDRTEDRLERIGEALERIIEEEDYGERLYDALKEKYGTEFVEEKLMPNDGIKCTECGFSANEVPDVCPGCGRIAKNGGLAQL